MATQEQEKKLIEMAKTKLECILLDDFIKIRRSLEDLDSDSRASLEEFQDGKDYEDNQNKLKEHNERYIRNVEDFKEEYGVEFPDLQKDYEEISIKIKKYLPQN